MARTNEIAEALLSIQAVALSLDPPFTWVSGIRSPIYCDNRLLISHPVERNQVIDHFMDHIARIPEKPEVIAGTATSGIPFAAWVADRLDLPMVYVRAAKKEHGKGKAIEGHLEPGKRTLVIEDLISTGKSSAAVVEHLREAGAVVTGVLAIFSYEMQKATDTFQHLGVPAEPLETISSLLQLAVSRGDLTDQDATVIQDFRNDPAGWYDRNFGN